MNEPDQIVNPYVEPALFPGGALSITIEAMLDPDEATVLFVVRAFDVGAGKLIALWSSSPAPFEDSDRERRRALREFGALCDQHSGPFP
jgi:hypothetical protein